ncbi:M13 family peptidase [Propionibacterium freudenreichii]|uniref:M13 family metallopeptidase n=1 Tax=Propionibacterium freudenreichii TaxID=1744 RepID=UPI0006DC9F36|nr:M13-type metalloendopeptidase [Propionibacterium freudenreichii]MDK9643565.1 M13 family peptidase [Propionibacterium freudenreichii]
MGSLGQVSTPAFHFEDFDKSVAPTTDLFRHVNGTWLKNAVIPDDRSNWGAFAILRENSEKAVHEIVEGLEAGDDPTTEQAKIANLYASFMDEETIEALGVSPLAPILARVDAIASVADLASFWGWSVRHGINPLADFDNDSDPGNPNRYLMFVGQAGIGLPDEEYYRLPDHEDLRALYLAHIRKSFDLAGVADADGQATMAFELEKQIAACHWDKVRTRDMTQMYFPQTWDDFTAATPTLEWDSFLAGAELPREAVSEVVNAQRTFLGDVAKLVIPENLDRWRAWARWQVVSGLSPYLNRDLSAQSFEFYSKGLRGVPKQRARWKRGVSVTEGVLGEAIGKRYVAKHFPPETKAAADRLVRNLLEAYRASISTLDWMTEATRAEALDKLSKFRTKIGYPDKWRDYSALEIAPDDLLGNVLRADSFEFDHTIEQLSGPVDRDEWFMYPQTVNAYYHPLRNEIVFPAAILQPPFFNVDADDAVNYGGIGGVIGHEIGHGFDDQGSTCDGDGRLRNWWTDDDRKAFEDRTHALIAQYNELAPSVCPEVHVNGELTIGENIGDLGGLSIAYQAWLLSLGGVEPAPQDGYTAAQRLFLGWAQVWQDTTRPEQMRQSLAVDPHSPDEIRCNQVVRNISVFHEAFGTKPGDPMWLEPSDRVQIW